MTQVKPRIFAQSDMIDFVSPIITPLLNSLDESALLYMDFYVKDDDFFVPSQGLYYADTTGCHHLSNLTGESRLLAAEALLLMDAQTTNLITLMEIWNGHAQAAERDYYIRLWMDRSGMVAVTPEDHEGWYDRNGFFISADPDSVIARSYLTKEPASGHGKLAAFPGLEAFHARIEKALSRFTSHNDIVVGPIDTATWVSFAA